MFFADQDRANRALRPLLRQLDDALKAGRAPSKAQSDVHDIGARFADLLLEQVPGGDVEAERKALAEALLAASEQHIHISHNLPMPLEILNFRTPIGGVGPFASMLGGRPEIYYPTVTRSGRPAGGGVAFFHDSQLRSMESGHWKDTLGSAFETIDEHEELTTGDLAAATVELQRLYGGTSSWAHFQCHAFYSSSEKRLRLTRNFPVDEDRFNRGGKYLVAVFLNCCRATELTEATPVPDDGLRSSWSEHFSSVGHVPAVIGPFCSLEDEQTMAFSEAFYRALAGKENVFDSFVAARAARLEDGDAAALAYRFLGLPSVELPFANRQARVAA